MPVSSASEGTSYHRRVLDDELDELLAGLPAISIEGPKGTGKTATATQRAATVHRLDDPATLEVVLADADRLVHAPEPILIDEWQRWQPSWDRVRRAVDDRPTPGRFLLTGSASPQTPATHSGAGRIVTVRMRPLTLAERDLERPTVSLARLLDATDPIEGDTRIGLRDYTEEIVRGGFPGMRSPSPRVQRSQLAGYVARIVDRDFEEAGHEVRNPQALRRWMTAYAAATGTTTSLEKIRDAATAGDGNTPARSTVQTYREVLERIWIADPLPGYVPTMSRLNRLTTSPKRYLADPALAVSLLNVTADKLLQGDEGDVTVPREGTLLGALLESLVALNVRVYAQAAEANVAHLRTKTGDREVDFLVEGHDGRTVAIEVKLAETPTGHDLRHLLWLMVALGDRLVNMVVLTTGKHAYRRKDGVAVVPVALLGP
jgi:predicted AAA+ superfamily ATPase